MTYLQLLNKLQQLQSEGIAMMSPFVLMMSTSLLTEDYI